MKPATCLEFKCESEKFYRRKTPLAWHWHDNARELLRYLPMCLSLANYIVIYDNMEAKFSDKIDARIAQYNSNRCCKKNTDICVRNVTISTLQCSYVTFFNSRFYILFYLLSYLSSFFHIRQTNFILRGKICIIKRIENSLHRQNDELTRKIEHNKDM